MSHPELSVATICTGNICRSPMAEVVLKHLIAEDPQLADHVVVTSAGTASWHVGSAMDPRARDALDRAGYRLGGSPGAYATREFLDAQDVVVVMTREHRGGFRPGLPIPQPRSFCGEIWSTRRRISTSPTPTTAITRSSTPASASSVDRKSVV